MLGQHQEVCHCPRRYKKHLKDGVDWCLPGGVPSRVQYFRGYIPKWLIEGRRVTTFFVRGPTYYMYSTLLYSLYSTLLYSILLYSTLPYSTLLYSTLLHFTLVTLLHCTLLHCTPLYST
jgi:hypothetical protein